MWHAISARCICTWFAHGPAPATWAHILESLRRSEEIVSLLSCGFQRHHLHHHHHHHHHQELIPLTCSSQSDSRKPPLVVRAWAKGWSSDSFKHSHSALLMKEDRSIWKPETSQTCIQQPETPRFRLSPFTTGMFYFRMNKEIPPLPHPLPPKKKERRKTLLSPKGLLK